MSVRAVVECYEVPWIAGGSWWSCASVVSVSFLINRLAFLRCFTDICFGVGLKCFWDGLGSFLDALALFLCDFRFILTNKKAGTLP